MGLAPYEEAVAKITGTATKFIESICLPAAEEYGVWWRDIVNRRRLNAAKIAAKASEIVSFESAENLGVPPRLVAGILELGSWSDDEQIQNMWAGLLASSCSPGGQNDSNLIYVDLLSRLTSAQVRYLNEYAMKAGRVAYCGDKVVRDSYPVGLLLQQTGGPTPHAFRDLMNHFISLGLDEISAGCYDEVFTEETQITPRFSELGLSLFAKGQGWRGEVRHFFAAQAGD